MSTSVNKTIYDGEYVVFPLKENNVEYKLESTIWHTDTNKMVSYNVNYFATGNKIEGIFSGQSVVYKLDLKNDHDLKTAEEFPTDTESILIVSVEPGYYAKLTLDVVDENSAEPIDSKTMAEIRHETAINHIMNGTEIGTWYQSFTNGNFHVEHHHTGLEKVVAMKDDSPYILSLEDHHHYAIYAEIYNDNNELRKYYREIFTGENMIEDDPQLKHIIQYKAQITSEGIDIDYVINLNIDNESLKIIRPYNTTAMIRLVDLGEYEQNDMDLLRWKAGYELGDKLYRDGDRRHIQNMRFVGGYAVMNGTMMVDISGYHDLVIVESITNEYLCTSSNAIINPDNPMIDDRCFTDCTIKEVETDVEGMRPGTYLIMNIDADAMNTHSIYDINIYGTQNKQEDETPIDEPSETTKDLDYLLKLYAKRKNIESKIEDIKFNNNSDYVYISPDKVERLKRVDEILDTLKDPNSEMSKGDTRLYTLATWLLGDPRANKDEK